MMATRGGAVALLCLLAGCSGGSGGTGAEPPRSFDDLEAEAMTLADDLVALDAVAGEDLPTSGTARYEGVMAVSAEDGSRLAGAMEMAVDFGAATDPISGRVTNIVDGDEQRYAGSLVLSDSHLDRTANGDPDPTYTALLGGTVTGPDDLSTRVNMGLSGTFIGEGASHTGGVADGNACTAGGCLDLDGVFVLGPPGGTDSGNATGDGDSDDGGTGAAVGGSVCGGDCDGAGGLVGAVPGFDPSDL